MANGNIITAIDVGTTKVCTLVARVPSKGNAEIIGIGIAPCSGLKRGNVVNVEETRAAIKASVAQAEEEARLKITSAYVGVTGSHIESLNEVVPLVSSQDNGVITDQQLNQYRNMVKVPAATGNRQLLHSIPISYALDGRGGIRNPVGMHVRKLEMQTQLITGASDLIRTLIDAVETAGLTMDGLVLEPLASGEAVLTDEEKDIGVVMCDIGGGTSDIAIFQDGGLVHTAIIPVGGYQFTNDISVSFDTSFDEAEEAKLEYGSVNPEQSGVDEIIEIPVVGQQRMARIPRRELCQIIKERAQELLQMVKLRLDEAPVDDTAKTRIVFTGGSANIPGLEQMARRVLSANVRIGLPMHPVNLPEHLVNPSYSTSVGILLWCMKEHYQKPEHVNGKNGSSNFYSRVMTWLLGRVKSVAALG